MKRSLTKEWIDSIPKTINTQGCWISEYRPTDRGYVNIQIDNQRYYLHRISMCVEHNIDYFNSNIETRHSTGCDKRCFNPKHVKPGSKSDNTKDSIKDGTHNHAKKTHCPKCGSIYNYVVRRIGLEKGKIRRFCWVCEGRRKRLKRLEVVK